MKSISHLLTRWFPVPSLLTPPAAGVDISDASIKWLVLDPAPRGHIIRTYGELPLESGIVVEGIVHDAHALALVLAQVRQELGNITCVHAALPEEAAYVFSMRVPAGTSREQILRMIEFEFEGRVPIPPSAAVYDYNPIVPHDSEEGDEVGVVVFPRDVADAYRVAFDASGLTLLSLEIEARSIARAVSSGMSDEPITLLVDFGRARTGFAVLKHGIPIFTSTVEVGGDPITRVLMEKMSMSAEDAEHFKNEEGLLAGGGANAKGLEVLIGTASALADEITRHYRYWDTRRNERGERMTPVGEVILVGGNSNLRGLADYVAGRIQAPVERGNVWQHVASFDDYVPPIRRNESLQYATAIGLALRGI